MSNAFINHTNCIDLGPLVQIRNLRFRISQLYSYEKILTEDKRFGILLLFHPGSGYRTTVPFDDNEECDRNLTKLDHIFDKMYPKLNHLDNNLRPL